MPVGTANFWARFEMAQPGHIDLMTGADRLYTLGVWLAWLAAAMVVLMHFTRLNWPLRAAALGLLTLLSPGIRFPVQRPRSLRLGRDGTAVLGGQEGRWGRYARSCRRYVILGIDLPRRRERVLVPASRNDVDEYRRLLVWVRFCPVSTSSELGLWRQS